LFSSLPPSSLDRCSLAFGPTRNAELLWEADQCCFLVVAMKAAASSAVLRDRSEG